MSETSCQEHKYFPGTPVEIQKETVQRQYNKCSSQTLLANYSNLPRAEELHTSSARRTRPSSLQNSTISRWLSSARTCRHRLPDYETPYQGTIS